MYPTWVILGVGRDLYTKYAVLYSLSLRHSRNKITIPNGWEVNIFLIKLLYWVEGKYFLMDSIGKNTLKINASEYLLVFFLLKTINYFSWFKLQLALRIFYCILTQFSCFSNVSHHVCTTCTPKLQPCSLIPYAHIEDMQAN